jgi:hypothetical protein
VATRREVAREIESSPNADFVAVSGSSALVIQVKSARKDVDRELERLHQRDGGFRSRNHGPDAGVSRYAGSGRHGAAMLAQGASTQEVLEGYPSLNQEQVELAPLYVAAFPRRGRPARRPWAKLKPLHVARYKLAKKA